MHQWIKKDLTSADWFKLLKIHSHLSFVLVFLQVSLRLILKVLHLEKRRMRVVCSNFYQFLKKIVSEVLVSFWIRLSFLLAICCWKWRENSFWPLREGKLLWIFKFLELSRLEKMGWPMHEYWSYWTHPFSGLMRPWKIFKTWVLLCGTEFVRCRWLMR